jgi:TPR repeat protein
MSQKHFTKGMSALESLVSLAVSDRKICSESLTRLRGYRQRDGIAGMKNITKGWSLIIQAAAAGHPVALSLCLRDGRECEKDPERAFRYNMESAMRGHPGALNSVGYVSASLQT